MSVSKDERRGTWTVQCWYRDWRGERHKKTRRGFATKSEAKRWEQTFLARCEGTPSMTLSEFFKLYEDDVHPRLKQSTWDTKEHMVRTKILPYLGERPLNEITSADVIRWQNELMAMRGPTGEPYRPTYLHTVSNQLSALLNHAVLHYNLPSNPARKVPKMGSKDAGEMSIWTKAQYLRFSRAIMDKPDSWMAFELLYWTGIREGELLALTPEDFELERGMLSITKTYHRRKGEDVVTPPKTPKANRRIVMPSFLVDEVRDYLALPGAASPGRRIFHMTKSRLYHELPARHRGTHGPRDDRGHPALRAPLPQQAGGDGARARRRGEVPKVTAPSRDRMGRRRSVTVGFRVSPEEAREIDALVALSGLTKQDYILRRLANREVTVYPSVRVQRAVQDQAMLCYEALRRIERAGDVTPELAHVLDTLAKTFAELGREAGPSAIDAEREAMRVLERESDGA